MRLTEQDFTHNHNDWMDWRWQITNAITKPEQLKDFMDITNLSECIDKFPMRITPYYLSLIDWDNPQDPIRLQAVPCISELETEEFEMEDPLAEEKMSPVRTIVHRYPDRVLFTVSSMCGTYCRHCTRKRWAGHLPVPFTKSDIDNGIKYIKEHKEIRDVVISGGDPLLLDDGVITYILDQLTDIDMVRIGTRTLVTLPMRITPSLAYKLGKYNNLWINTHFNHKNEITALSAQACNLLQKQGIPINNQSVLLRNVNDNLPTMRDLLHSLMKIRVRPYYLYQCDLAIGLKHFRTPIQTGIDLIKNLRGYTSGLCIPQYVIDSPNGGGKVPINPDYVTSCNDKFITFRNYKGEEYKYPTGSDI